MVLPSPALDDFVEDENGVGVMSVIRERGTEPFFRVKFWDLVDRNRRFYNHCLRRFGQR